MVDRYNPFADSVSRAMLVGGQSAAADLAKPGGGPTRPYEPAPVPVTPEPGTPVPPSWGYAEKKHTPPQGPPIYVPPVEGGRRTGYYPPWFLRGRRGGNRAGSRADVFSRMASAMGAQLSDFNRQYAGAQTGWSGNAAFDRASAADQAFNRVVGRRNLLNPTRGYQYGARTGRGGRQPVFSQADMARRQQLINAVRPSRPSTPRTYTPRVHNSILYGML